MKINSFQSDYNQPIEGTPTASKEVKLAPAQAVSIQRGGGKIPIYRRGYGAAQNKPRALVWDDGRLLQVAPESSQLFVNSNQSEQFSGRGLPISAPRFRPFRGDFSSRPVGRGAARGRGRGRDTLSGLLSPTGSAASSRPRKDEGTGGTFKIPEMDSVSIIKS